MNKISIIAQIEINKFLSQSEYITLSKTSQKFQFYYKDQYLEYKNIDQFEVRKKVNKEEEDAQIEQFNYLRENNYGQNNTFTIFFHVNGINQQDTIIKENYDKQQYFENEFINRFFLTQQDECQWQEVQEIEQDEEMQIYFKAHEKSIILDDYLDHNKQSDDFMSEQ